MDCNASSDFAPPKIVLSEDTLLHRGVALKQGAGPRCGVHVRTVIGLL